MCIEKVLSFQFAGKLYADELSAVKAALAEIGTRIIRDHSANPTEGLLKYGMDITPLRDRYLALRGEAPAPAEPVKVYSDEDGENADG